MINILIVDDQKSVCARLEYLIELIADFKVIGVAENGTDAIAKVKLLQPDIVLLDMELPEISGLMVTKIISQDFPQIKILVLSSHDKQEYVIQSMSAGAAGYLLKGSSDEEIEQAIRFVAKGCTHLGAGLFAKMLPIVEQSSLFDDLPIKGELTLRDSALTTIANNSWQPSTVVSPKKQILAWLILTLALTTGIYTFRQWLRKPLPALSYAEQSATLTGTKFTGKLEPAKSFKIAAIAPGIVDEIYIQIGDTVEVGQPLLSLKNLSAENQKKSILQEQQLTSEKQQILFQQQQTAKQQINELELQISRLRDDLVPLKTRIAEANRQVALAKSEAEKLPLRQRQDSIPRTQALYERAKARFERLQKLNQQGAIPLEQLEQAQSELEVAKVDYQVAITASTANQQLAQSQQQLSQLEEKLALQEQQDAIAQLSKQKQNANLEYQQVTAKLRLLNEQAAALNKYQVPEVYQVIKATEAGVVAALPIPIGEQVHTGSPAIELAKLENLKITVPVNARLINALRPQQSAMVEIGSGVTAQKFEAKIATVNPLPTEKLNYLVEVEFQNPTQAILVGQLAQVQFLPQRIAGGE